MQADPDQNTAVQKPRVKDRRSAVVLTLVVVIIVLSAAAIFIPVQDGPHGRRRANEAAAVGKLRLLTTLQMQYASAYPSKGFACELALLKTETPPKGEYDPEAFLLADSYAGYKFSLSGCETNPNGVVIRYKATAIPRVPGETGVRAFCTDQKGEIWYDPSGSAENCLAARRPI